MRLLILIVFWSAGFAYAGGRVFVGVDATGLPTYTDRASGQKDALNHIDLRQAPPQPNTVVASNPPRHPRGLLAPQLLAQTLNAAQKNAVPAALILAVMHAESDFDPAARSSAGAVGLMQIMPSTGQRYGAGDRLNEPGTNIEIGARYLGDLLTRFRGDIRLALAAYNAGEGAVSEHGYQVPPYAETQAYVPKVMKLFDQYTRSIKASHLKPM